ncbi:helix-turn-helix domain-containing protein [Verrucomicrobiaceae bacterium N1E253]|uniref:Helix-turn-helix domain-containing protein n=1 Tax=Oceaniferula marina TaxID=2748318 RepID=A0A851GCT4_9BACT|nr:helix-turn-helix domain-containing protein [Oceaniferula marina]NWK55236.1 helix-turn-helix domain-containing protein [Oceaniferula marina]
MEELSTSSLMNDMVTPYEPALRLRVGFGHTVPVEGASGGSPRRRRTLRPQGTPDWCLLIILKGHYVVSPESEHAIDLHPGSAVLFPPHRTQDHILHESCDEGKMFWAHFFPEASMLPYLDWPKPPKQDARVMRWDSASFLNEQIHEACRHCAQYMDSNYDRKRSLALLRLEEVLGLIYQSHPDKKIKQMDDRVVQSLQHISDGIGSPLSAQMLAAKAGLSVSRFSLLFRQNMKCSIMEYVEGQRLSIARRMLADTTLPVSLIAETCGFSSVYYFSKRFRKFHEMSPSEHRHQSNL